MRKRSLLSRCPTYIRKMSVKSEGLAVVSVKIMVLWDVLLCALIDRYRYHRFGGTRYPVLDTLILKLVAGPVKKLVFTSQF